MFNGLTVLSLVLFAATMALWVRSTRSWDGLSYVRPESADGQRYFSIVSYAGRIALRTGLRQSGHYLLSGLSWDAPSLESMGLHSGVWDFHFSAGRIRRPPAWWGNPGPPADSFIYADFPTWCAFLLSAILPASRVIALRKGKHRCESCRYCGYNLTGNVSGVCPECGKPIAK